MSQSARHERNGFVYVADCRYETDPATLAAVRVGDKLHVADHLSPAPLVPRDFSDAVTAVARDEYGMYFEFDSGRRANTIIHVITAA